MAPPCPSSFDTAVQIENFLHRIFPSLGHSQKILNLLNIEEYLDRILKADTPILDNVGRIGYDSIVLDRTSNVGSFLFDHDHLGITGISTFSTITANACVYKGKWMYEVMLGSKGLMQIGWATAKCEFSATEGVGDTEHSYAYDGNRQRKWNRATVKYGDLWATGDIISCTIDLDEGVLGFYRNGVYMGDAYSDIEIGPTFAYFPAISLSAQENIRVNFGSTPLKYPVQGYRPLQDPPTQDLQRACQLIKYFERLLTTMVDNFRSANDVDLVQLGERADSIKLILANHILDKLAPLMSNAYIAEAVLLKLLLKFCNTSRHTAQQPYINKLLDVLWMCMEEYELKDCFQNLLVSILTFYRFSPVSADFGNQQTYLILLLSILRHTNTRRLLLQKILFDIIQFPAFMHIKPPDDKVLTQLIPTVWWDKKTNKCDSSSPEYMETDDAERDEYETSCGRLKEKVSELEEIQVEIVKVLLTDKDASGDSFLTSRDYFLTKFKEFLKSTLRGSCITSSLQCSLPVTLCFFHRLAKALVFHWDQLAKRDSRFPSSSDAYVLPSIFTNEKSTSVYCLDRIGGLFSFLRRTVKLSPFEMTNDITSTSAIALMEILDGLILLYHTSAHKQLIKMSSLRDNVRELVSALNDTEAKLKICPEWHEDVRNELLNSKEVLENKTIEGARHMSWIISIIFAKEKQEDVHWLLLTCLRTVEAARKLPDVLMYLPELYLEVVLDCYKALTRYFSSFIPFEGVQGYISTLNKMAAFLADHFSDTRILSNDVKDNVIQSLACFVCYPESLKSLEQISIETRKQMVKTLLSPYDSRVWPQINWILVRLWKGCGFGYRYEFPPNMSPARLKQYTHDYETASFQKPCPSLVFQQHVAELLTQDEKLMLNFLNSVLNQLNWAFSEFVTIINDIQRTGSIFDKRKFKLCGTCFDLTVGLLRVIELTVAVAPQLFTDVSRNHSEVLLSRLMQLISQVLARVTSKDGAFREVISKKRLNLDNVDYYPVLTAVAGILTKLLLSHSVKGRELAVQALVSSFTFTIESVQFMLRQPLQSTSRADKVFSFLLCKDISEREVSHVRQAIEMIEAEIAKRPAPESISDDDLCPICCSGAISAKFQPCGHTSCRSCIMHQMMNKKECFYCKQIVEKYVKISKK